MKTTDFSHEIFERYFESEKTLKITLKDSTILTGMLVGFFHGEDENDPYIVKWHFIKESKIKGYDRTVGVNEADPDMLTIMQKDIDQVDFK